MSKEQLANEYCDMKQAQGQGSFSEHELFIIKFAFMAGYDANKPSGMSDADIETLSLKILAETCHCSKDEVLEQIDNLNAVLKVKYCLEGINAMGRYVSQKIKSKS